MVTTFRMGKYAWIFSSNAAQIYNYFVAKLLPTGSRTIPNKAMKTKGKWRKKPIS